MFRPPILPGHVHAEVEARLAHDRDLPPPRLAEPSERLGVPLFSLVV